MAASVKTRVSYADDLHAWSLEQAELLRAQVTGRVLEAYPDAVKRAVDETGLPIGCFPVHCPYGADDVLAEDYLPDAAI